MGNDTFIIIRLGLQYLGCLRPKGRQGVVRFSKLFQF